MLAGRTQSSWPWAGGNTPPLGTSQLWQAQAASLRLKTTWEVHSAPRSPAENQALQSV